MFMYVHHLQLMKILNSVPKKYGAGWGVGGSLKMFIKSPSKLKSSKSTACVSKLQNWNKFLPFPRWLIKSQAKIGFTCRDKYHFMINSHSYLKRTGENEIEWNQIAENMQAEFLDTDGRSMQSYILTFFNLRNENLENLRVPGR